MIRSLMAIAILAGSLNASAAEPCAEIAPNGISDHRLDMMRVASQCFEIRFKDVPKKWGYVVQAAPSLKTRLELLRKGDDGSYVIDQKFEADEKGSVTASVRESGHGTTFALRFAQIPTAGNLVVSVASGMFEGNATVYIRVE